MKPESWKLVEDFFVELKDLGAEARSERLEAIRKTHPDVHTELKSLIEAHDEADELLGDFENLVSEPDFEPLPDPVPRLNAALEGRYRIERELGEGGMATIYLADDLKHARKVAVKVLRPELAAIVGADRFLAEIKTTANLQHPNILPLFDSGEADGFLFYVMPYADGDTLRDRLDREGQLPVSEAVAIAKDMAEALQAAHEQGVIHRDIKPSNVLISRGKPLIADFGIALALRSAGAGERLTEAGLSLGTPYYMSPEQATGDQAVGPPADTYSLGCVLYEMLVGAPPHDGRTAQAVLSKIVAGKPTSAREERPSVPANVDAAVRKALERLPADRFASVREFADALEDEHFRYGELATVGAGAASGPWNRLSMGLAGLLALTGVALASNLLDRAAPEVVRFTVPVGLEADAHLGGPAMSWGRPFHTSLAFSPDGDLLVYAAQSGAWNDSRLYLLRLDQERAEPIEGTEDALNPFFSPDGAWIGFSVRDAQTSDMMLKRISVADGGIETITHLPQIPSGATWGDDETIVYATGGSRRLFRVPAAGGEPEVLVEADGVPGGLRRFAQPHMLPGSETLLFHAKPASDPTTSEIVALDFATGTRKTVLADAMDPRYVQPGHLLFMRQGTLMAIAFDPERVEVRGEAVIILEDVMHAILSPSGVDDTGAAQLAVSASGHLAYALGGVHPESREMAVRVTSSGDTVNLDLGLRDYTWFRVSPDGESLAFTDQGVRRSQIWVHDLDRGVSRRLNTGGFNDNRMEWSPDGRSLAFQSDRDRGIRNIYSIAVDGTGEPEQLAPSERDQVLLSWSSKGVIAYREIESGDIWVLPPDGSPAPFLTSGSIESYATFSPDGQWLAYVSIQDGQRTIYVQPYPGPGPATLIATDGDPLLELYLGNPGWSPDGRQIYFAQRRPDGDALMAVDVTPGEDFQVGRPAPLITPWALFAEPRGWDVFPDGSFVTRVAEEDTGEEGEVNLRRLEQFGATELHVVLNWVEELKERLPN